MRGYKHMSEKDFYNMKLIIPIGILNTYTKQQLKEILLEGTKVSIMYEDKIMEEITYENLCKIFR